MLCCFFNSISGILALLGLSNGGQLFVGGLWFWIIALIVNGSIIGFFIKKAMDDPAKKMVVLAMVFGFTLTGSNYIYKIINHSATQKKFCKGCINKDEGCCQLDCHHRKQCQKSCNKSSTPLIFNILGLVGAIINIIAFIYYWRRFRCSKECSTTCGI
jgi:hypothetical protein